MRISLGARHDFLRKHGVAGNWEACTLSSLSRVVGGGTPSRDEGRFWVGGNIPWATPTDLTKNHSKYISETTDYITEAGLASSAATLLPPGSVLYTSRATIGAKAIAKVPIATNQGFVNFLPHSVDGEYLYYLLDLLTPIIKRLGAGTTFDEVSKRDIRSVWCAVPADPKEQASIVCILDAVDTALNLTRVAVEQAQELRLGLLQSVFEFRMSKESKKQSEVGLIPESWDAIKGKKAFVIVTGGCSSVDALRLPRDGNEPDAWFMKVDDFNEPENRRAIVRTKIGFCAADNPLFKALPPGTLIIAKRGAAILKNRVRATRVPVAIDPNLMALQVLPGINSEFLRYQIEWRKLSRYVEDSGVPQLNNKDLYPRYFLKAQKSSQLEIIKTLAAAEANEDVLISKYEAFELLKKSLMHDLLTGRVRVKKLLEGTAQ